MGEGIRIGGGGKPEGQYVWKKYSRVTKSVTLSFSHTPPNIWNVSSNDIDVHSIDASFFVGFSGTYAGPHIFEFLNSNQAKFGGSTVISFTYNPTTAQITFGSTISSNTITVSDSTQEKEVKTFIDYVVDDNENAYPNGGTKDGYWYEYANSGICVWKKLTAEGGDFIDFVVSDNVIAYPDGGEQGGYWYEKVVEGKAGIDYGEVTITDSSQNIINITHSLGVTPSRVLLVPISVGTIATVSAVKEFMHYYSPNYYGTINSTTLRYIVANTKSYNISIGTDNYQGDSVDSTSITFRGYNSGVYFYPGTYLWIAIA